MRCEVHGLEPADLPPIQAHAPTWTVAGIPFAFAQFGIESTAQCHPHPMNVDVTVPKNSKRQNDPFEKIHDIKTPVGIVWPC